MRVPISSALSRVVTDAGVHLVSSAAGERSRRVFVRWTVSLFLPLGYWSISKPRVWVMTHGSTETKLHTLSFILFMVRALHSKISVAWESVNALAVPNYDTPAVFVGFHDVFHLVECILVIVSDYFGSRIDCEYYIWTRAGYSRMNDLINRVGMNYPLVVVILFNDCNVFT